MNTIFSFNNVLPTSGTLRRFRLFLPLLLAWFGLLSPLAAETEGDFEYSFYRSGDDDIQYTLIHGYTGSNPAVVIPAAIRGRPVQWITGLGNNFLMTSAFIPSSVKYLDDDTFINCINLTSVNVPNGVSWIGSRTFYNCSALTSITIPNSVTFLGERAFEFCEALAGVTISNSITSIERNTFSNCVSLTSVTIPASVTSIGEWAFNACHSLTSITIPDSITSIGEGAFEDCGSLTSVTLPNSITSIERRTFLGCGFLTNTTIPNSVTSIGERAFAGCASLTSVNIPNSVTSIGESTFYYCLRLTSVNIPNSVTSIGISAFDYCSALLSIEVTSSNPAFCSVEGVLFNHDKTSLAQYPGGKMGSYTIPNSVTSIGERAFSACEGLTGLSIPNSVTLIGTLAFWSCKGLTSITIPDSVTSIGDYAFQFCDGLTSISIPDSITSLGGGTFGWCRGLITVTIPNSVTSIGYQAFTYCTALTSVIISDSVTSIEKWAFLGCRSLVSITIPESVTSLGEGAFAYCNRLTGVLFEGDAPGTFGEGVFADTAPGFTISYYEGATGFTSPTWMGYPAMTVERSDFTYTSDGSSITITGYNGSDQELLIPDTIDGLPVRTIGNSALMGKNLITRVTIPSSVTSIGDNAFNGCSSLTEAVIANSVTSLGAGAFEGCSLLQTIDIPSGVTTINARAFFGCSSLESAVFSGGLVKIGDQSFAGCTSLNSCLFLGNAPAMFGTNVFPGHVGFVIYYYPDSTGFTTSTWNGYPCEPIRSRYAVGKVAVMKGADFSIIRDGEPIAVNLGTEIYQDDVVVTGVQSFLKILFYNNGSAMNIGPKSRLEIHYDINTINLIRGQIRFHKTSGERIFIRTGLGGMGVRGTTLTVEVTEANGTLTTMTEVLEGVIDFENLLTGQITEIRTGESMSVQAAVETHTLTILHPSATLGTLWINGAEITIFPHVANYSDGTEINLQATAGAAGVFSNWSGDFVSTNPTYTFHLDEDMMLTANFLEWTNFTDEHPGLTASGDANHNGASNFLVYASGQNPEAAGTLPIVELNDHLLTMRQRINGQDAPPVVQYSYNLGTWFTLEEGTHYTVISRTATGEMFTLVVELVSEQETERFFRQRFGP